MRDIALEILAITDIHYEFLPFSPKQTIERILDCSDVDAVVNLGDNSGKYAAQVKKIVGDKRYLSVLGNHDAIGLNIKLPSKPNHFLFNELSVKDRKAARRYGYGVFNGGQALFSPIKFDSRESDFRMYITYAYS